jgi:adenylate cyclase
MAFPLPDKPSIVVLPIVNISGDPDQDYIAKGITENITTALSNIPEIFVIDKDSTSIYRGKDVKLQQVAQDLGVRYVVKGSMQKSGDKIRVTGQLVDALAGRQLWSEKYDRERKDFFQIMDEITQKIMIELQVKLTHGEQVRKWYGTTNLEAWGYIARGQGIFENFTRANTEKARELFKKALEIDPKCAYGWVMLANTLLIDVRLGWTKNPKEAFKNVIEMNQKALSIDDKSAEAYMALGFNYMTMRKHEKAIEYGQKSVDVSPNSAQNHILFSQIMYYSGNLDKAIASAEKAVRLSPRCPGWYWLNLGRPYMLAGRHQDALAMFEKMLEKAREYELWRANLYLALTYSLMGQTETAQIHLAEAQKLYPDLSLEYHRKTSYFKDPKQLEVVLDALRKAGLK